MVDRAYWTLPMIGVVFLSERTKAENYVVGLLSGEHKLVVVLEVQSQGDESSCYFCSRDLGMTHDSCEGMEMKCR